jgi:hypothetical protein
MTGPNAGSKSMSWAVLAIPAFVLALFPEVVLEGRVFYERDVHLVWYSQVESFVRAVRGGSWPVWDPYVSFGHPMLANPNTQVLYPPTWLNLLLVPESAYVALTLLHVSFAAFGLYFFARRLGLGLPASLSASLLWAASGPLLSLVNVWHHLAGASWLPWVLLAADRALGAPSLRGAALTGLALGAQVLAGSPDMSAFTGLAVAALVLARLDSRAPFGAANRRRAATAALALLLGLGLAAGQLLPSLELARQSPRWNIDPGMRAIGSLHPGALLKLLSPVPLAELPLDPVRGAALLDEGMPFLRSLYLGGPALGLVLAALLGPPRRGRRFLALLGAGSLLFALGRHTPVYAALVMVFPPLRSLRYPSKAAVLVALSGALLAGMGVEAWRDAAGARRRRWLLGIALPMAIVAVLLAAASRAAADPPGWLADLLLAEDVLHRTWRDSLAGPATSLRLAAAFSAAAALVCVLRVVRARWRSGLAATVVVLAMADLWAAGHGLNRTAPRTFYRFRPSAIDAVEQRDFSRLFVRSYPESRPLLGVENPYKIAGYPEELSLDAGRALGARLALMPPVGAAWGLFASYEPDLLGLFPNPLAETVSRAGQAEGTPAYRRYLELGAVTHLLALDEHGVEGLTLLRTLPSPLVLPLRLFRVPEALSRTYVVGAAQVADGEAAHRILEDPAFDPRHGVVLDSGAPAEEPPRFTGESRILELRADRVRLEANASGPGFVVLVDTFDPGWRARVDGDEVPLLRANRVFRAVALPAGRHTVDLVYRPRSVLIGFALSAATLVGLLLVLARAAPGMAAE